MPRVRRRRIGGVVAAGSAVHHVGRGARGVADRGRIGRRLADRRRWSKRRSSRATSNDQRRGARHQPSRRASLSQVPTRGRPVALPFLFAMGHDPGDTLPARTCAPRCGKPVNPATMGRSAWGRFKLAHCWVRTGPPQRGPAMRLQHKPPRRATWRTTIQHLCWAGHGGGRGFGIGRQAGAGAHPGLAETYEARLRNGAEKPPRVRFKSGEIARAGCMLARRRPVRKPVRRSRPVA